MKKYFLFLITTVMSAASIATTELPQSVQDQIREAIDEKTWFYQADEIFWSPHEVFATQTDKTQKGETTTYAITYDVGMGNEYDESVVYSIECKAEVSETAGKWSQPRVECENSNQIDPDQEG